jgi:hypothetical protein
VKIEDPIIPEQEAGDRLRDLLATELMHFEHPQLDRFLTLVPTMRMSDLVAYLSDLDVLLLWIGGAPGNVLTDVEKEYLRYAGYLAIKAEIDRRFPVTGVVP